MLKNGQSLALTKTSMDLYLASRSFYVLFFVIQNVSLVNQKNVSVGELMSEVATQKRDFFFGFSFAIH